MSVSFFCIIRIMPQRLNDEIMRICGLHSTYEIQEIEIIMSLCLGMRLYSGQQTLGNILEKINKN